MRTRHQPTSSTLNNKFKVDETIGSREFNLKLAIQWITKRGYIRSNEHALIFLISLRRRTSTNRIISTDDIVLHLQIYFLIPKASSGSLLLEKLSENESLGVTGKLDNRSRLQIGHLLFVPNISCKYILLRQVTVQRHSSHTRNILSLISGCLMSSITTLIPVMIIISTFYYLTFDYLHYRISWLQNKEP